METIEKPASLALAGMKGVRRVADSQRLGTLPRYFGPRMFGAAEGAIYNFAQKMFREYRGAGWDYYVKRGSEALILVPAHSPGDGLWTVVCEENYAEYRLPSDAAGIVVCLFAYNNLSNWCARHGTENDTERFAGLYHAVLDVAADHPLRGAILRLID